MIQTVYAVGARPTFSVSYFDLCDRENAVSLAGLFEYEGMGVSMLPTIHEGQRLGVCPQVNYEEGDVILCFNESRFVCHRISRCLADGRFETKGDNNNFVDEHLVSPENIVGKVSLVLPKRNQQSLLVKFGSRAFHRFKSSSLLRKLIFFYIFLFSRGYIALPANLRLFKGHRLIPVRKFFKKVKTTQMMVLILHGRCIGVRQALGQSQWIHPSLIGCGVERILSDCTGTLKSS